MDTDVRMTGVLQAHRGSTRTGEEKMDVRRWHMHVKFITLEQMSTICLNVALFWCMAKDYLFRVLSRIIHIIHSFIIHIIQHSLILLSISFILSDFW